MMSRWGARKAPEDSAAGDDLDELRDKLRVARRKLKQTRESRAQLRQSLVREVMDSARAEKLTYLKDLHLSAGSSAGRHWATVQP